MGMGKPTFLMTKLAWGCALLAAAFAGGYFGMQAVASPAQAQIAVDNSIPVPARIVTGNNRLVGLVTEDGGHGVITLFTPDGSAGVVLHAGEGIIAPNYPPVNDGDQPVSAPGTGTQGAGGSGD